MLTSSRRLRLIAVVLSVTLGAASAAPAPPPLSPVEVFLEQVDDYLDELEPLVGSYGEQVAVCRQGVEALGATYDAILTTEPSGFRDALIENYRRDRPTAVADLLNVETATRTIEPRLNAARDFLHDERYTEYRDLSLSRDLDDLLLKGHKARTDARNIPRPPPLPDPIPDPIPPAEVVEVSYPDLGLIIGKTYSVEVEVKNNCRFTERIVNVEIRVRSGPAKISGSLFQTITLTPGKRGVLSWKFTPTDEGDFVISARIAR